MSVSLTFLGLLEREPSYGYDLKRAYDSYFARGKPLSFGQVYTTLARLARDGKAVAGPPEHGDGPDRKRYSITAAGMAEVDTWLTTPAEPEPQQQQPQYAPPPPPAPAPDPIAQLKQLAELKEQGILTDQEFADQKARILAS